MLEKLKKKAFYAQGLYFSCKRCSTCCRFEEGFVFLNSNDIVTLSTALDMKYDIFVKIYCRWVPVKNGKSKLSLKEKSNYDCIFWNSELSAKTCKGQDCQGQDHAPIQDGCSVYEYRPLQCRMFPFWASVVGDEKSWEMTAQSCPGINQGDWHSVDSIKSRLAIQQKQAVVSRNEFLMANGEA